MRKIQIALLLSITYILLSLPITYTWSDTFAKKFTIRTSFDNCPGLPTLWGSITHGLFFLLFSYAILVSKNDDAPTIKIEKFKGNLNTKDIFEKT